MLGLTRRAATVRRGCFCSARFCWGWPGALTGRVCCGLPARAAGGGWCGACCRAHPVRSVWLLGRAVVCPGRWRRSGWQWAPAASSPLLAPGCVLRCLAAPPVLRGCVCAPRAAWLRVLAARSWAAFALPAQRAAPVNGLALGGACGCRRSVCALGALEGSASGVRCGFRVLCAGLTSCMPFGCLGGLSRRAGGTCGFGHFWCGPAQTLLRCTAPLALCACVHSLWRLWRPRVVRCWAAFWRFCPRQPALASSFRCALASLRSAPLRFFPGLRFWRLCRWLGCALLGCALRRW